MYPGRPFGFPVVVSDRTHFHCDTAVMDGESKRVLEYLTEVEVAAEDVLTTKQQVTKNDLRRIRCLYFEVD